MKTLTLLAAAAVTAIMISGCADKTQEAATTIAQDMLKAVNGYDNEKLLSHVSEDMKQKVQNGGLYLASAAYGHYEIVDVKIDEDRAIVKLKLIVDSKKMLKSAEKYEPLSIWVFRIDGGEWKLVSTNQESQI